MHGALGEALGEACRELVRFASLQSFIFQSFDGDGSMSLSLWMWVFIYWPLGRIGSLWKKFFQY